MKESVVRARIDSELKAQAAAVLAACGLELSDAIRLFLRQVVVRGGIPFPVRNRQGVSVVAPARLHAMKQAAQARAAKVKWPSASLSGSTSRKTRR